MKKLVTGILSIAVATTCLMASYTRDDYSPINTTPTTLGSNYANKVNNFNDLNKAPFYIAYYDLHKKDGSRVCVDSKAYFSIFFEKKINTDRELITELQRYTTKAEAYFVLDGFKTIVQLTYKEGMASHAFWQNLNQCKMIVDSANSKLR